MPKPVPPHVTHCLDLLSPVGDVRAKSMFGGWGLSLDGESIALIADERLYLKVDGTSRSAFQSAGGEPFRYARKDGSVATMASYWTPPEEALESPGDMLPWARRAVEAARRTAKPKKKKVTA